jgi:N-acetylglucosaminyldiphosphoundecaprenol N-acetyl-beta-D-mannosaminyltransferase
MASVPDHGIATPFTTPNFMVQPSEPVCLAESGIEAISSESPWQSSESRPSQPLPHSNSPGSANKVCKAEVGPIHAPVHPAIPPVPTRRLWGIDFASVTTQQALDRIDVLVFRHEPTFVITANLNYVMLCDSNVNLPIVTQQAAMVLCDGMPILWRSKIDPQSLPERVAGSDLIYKLCERAAFRGHRVYFLGAAEGVAQKAADRLAKMYPGLIVAGVDCPPFREWDEFDRESINCKIVAAKPDILLVAFGQPKGEFWIYENYKKLGVPVSIQLGASFDFVAGTARRAPKIFQRVGLEWLYRAVSQPARLAPRYWKNFCFLMKTLRQEIIASASKD